MFYKKAFVRIIEALISTLIISVAVMILLSNQTQKNDFSESIYEKQKQILFIIINNDSLRNDIMLGDNTKIREFIAKNIPVSWDFTINICNIDETCNQNIPDFKDIYVTESIITANLTDYSELPKKLKLSIWMK